jgi:EpsI family protein
MSESHRPRRTWWAYLPWLLIPAGLAAAYAHTFSEMWIRWFPAWRHSNLGLYDRVVQGESYYTHGPLVPLVVAVMVVLIVRHTRIPLAPRRGWGGAVLAAGLLVHLAACLARVNFVSGFSLIIVLAGLVLFFWGTTALRRFWFPLVLLTFMVPLPEVTIANLNFHLRNMAASAGVGLANAAGIMVERMGDKGNQVLLEGGKTLVIANVCNGLRTLISLLAFGAVYAYVCKLRGGWRLFVFALSVPVAMAANAVRVVGLILVADVWDVPTATGAFHDISGLLIYPLAYLLMFLVERAILGLRQWAGRPAQVLPLFHGVLRGPDDADPWPPLAGAVVGRAGWLAAVLILVTAGGAYALNRAVPAIWNQRMAAQALPPSLDLDGRRWDSYDLEMDEQTLTILETRDYLYRRYLTPGVPPVDFSIVFSRDNRKGTHPPDLCLEGGGGDIVSKEDVVLHDVAGRGDVACRALVVQAGGRRDYFLYVYKCGDRYTPSFWTQQAVIFSNSLLGRNASGALIRVSTPISDSPEAASRRSMRMLSAALPHLDRALP